MFSDQFIAISPEGEYMYTFVYPEEIASMNNPSHYVVIQYNTDGDLVFCYPEQINDMTGGFRYRCFYIDDEAEGLGREYKFPDIGSFCPYFGEGYDVFLTASTASTATTRATSTRHCCLPISTSTSTI